MIEPIRPEGCWPSGGAEDCRARRSFNSCRATIPIRASASGRKTPKLKNQNRKNGILKSPLFWVQPRCQSRIDPACILSEGSQTKITAGRTGAATSVKSGDLEGGRLKNRTEKKMLKAIKVWV